MPCGATAWFRRGIAMMWQPSSTSPQPGRTRSLILSLLLRSNGVPGQHENTRQQVGTTMAFENPKSQRETV